MKMIFCFAAFASLAFVGNAFCQDPGMPDSVIVGNLDGSPLYVVPGETLQVPIYFKNDEDVDRVHFITGTAKNLGYAMQFPEYFGHYDIWSHWCNLISDDSLYPDYYILDQNGISHGHINENLNTDSTW